MTPFSLFHRLWSRSLRARPVGTIHKPNRRPRHLGQLELLEDRVTPAVTASVDSNNVLTVTLSAAGDEAFITSSSSGIRVGTTSGGNDVLADTTGIVRIDLADSGSKSDQVVSIDGTVIYNLAGFSGIRIQSTGIETINLNQAISATDQISGNATTVNVAAQGQIQVGVNLAAAGGTVNVAAGTYVENVVINKPLELLGAQAGVDASTGTRPENPTVSSIVTVTSGDIVRINSQDVVIDGFVFDGQGVADYGLSNEDDSNPGQYVLQYVLLSKVQIRNNVVRGVLYDAITIDNDDEPATNNKLVTGNFITDWGQDGTDFYAGVYTTAQAYTDIIGNRIIDTGSENIAVWIQNQWGGPSGLTIDVTDNVIEVGQDSLGIHVNNIFLTSGLTITIEGNTVTAAVGVTPGVDTATWGINLWSIDGNTDVVIQNNTIGGSGGTFDRGYNIWNIPTTGTISIDGGSVANAVIGVNFEGVDSDSGFGAGRTADEVLSIDDLTITGGTVGIRLINEKVRANSPNNSMTLALSGVTITGATTGLEVLDDTTADSYTTAVSFGLGNVITGGVTGILISGSETEVVGDTFVDLVFTGQSGNYVTLADNALFGQVIDGQDVTYDGVLGENSTPAQLTAIENKLFHRPDDPTLGLIQVREAVVITRVTPPGTGDLPADGLGADTYLVTGLYPNSLVTVTVPLGTVIYASDASPLPGLQLVADSTGSLSFTLRRPTGAGASVITVQDTASPVNGSFTQIYSPPEVRRIDFGPIPRRGRDRHGFYVPWTTQLYTPAAGMGWVGSAPNMVFDRGAVSEFLSLTPREIALSDTTRDGVGSNAGPRDFRIDLPNGTYAVTLVMGDLNVRRDQMRVEQVSADGLTLVSTLFGSLTTGQGRFAVETFTVTISDGALRLRFSDLGGTNPMWVVNSLEVRPLPATPAPSPLPGPNAPHLSFEPQRLLTLTSPAATADGSLTTYTVLGTTPWALLTVQTAWGTLVGTDASARLRGFQVRANGAGVATFTIRNPVSVGDLTGVIRVTEATGAGGGILNQTWLGGGPLALDFNASSAATVTAPGFRAVLPGQVAPTVTGFGWDTAVSAVDRGIVGTTPAPARVFRDFHYGSGPTTFRVAVGNASLSSLTLYSFDTTGTNLTNQTFTIENLGTFTRTGPVTTINLTGWTHLNLDGLIDITVNNVGANWVLNGLQIA